MKKKFCFVLIGSCAAIFAFPILATIWMAFWDGKFGLDAWRDLLLDCFPFYPMFWNSVFYSVVITVFHIILVVPCAFGMIMAKTRWKKLIFYIYLILMMMPLQVTILPNYIGLRDLGLLNTRACIILPMVFSAFGVVVMHQYMLKLDIGQIEAARMETSSVLKILFYIVVPNMKVCIYAVGLFIFAESFNMLEQPMLFLKDSRLQNLSVFIANAGEYEGDVLFSAALIFMIPTLLLYLFFSDTLEKGLTVGDLRGREG